MPPKRRQRKTLDENAEKERAERQKLVQKTSGIDDAKKEALQKLKEEDDRKEKERQEKLEAERKAQEEELRRIEEQEEAIAAEGLERANCELRRSQSASKIQRFYLMKKSRQRAAQRVAKKRELRNTVYLVVSCQRLFRKYQNAKGLEETEKQIKYAIVVQKAARSFLVRMRIQHEKMQEKRTLIAKEMLHTENNYATGLRLAISVYAKPLRAFFPNRDPIKDADKPDRGVCEQDLDVIFSNIEELSIKHAEFYSKLKERIQDWDEHTCVGDIFLEMASWLDIYIPYCNNFDKANAELARCMSIPYFFEKHEMIRNFPGCNKQNLKGFLINPIQRIPRYELLLRDILKKTWASHADFEPLTEALEQINLKAKGMNQKKTVYDNKIKLLELQKTFAEQNISMDNTSENLFKTGLFIREGMIQFRSSPKSETKPIYCYLFNGGYSEGTGIVKKSFRKKTSIVIVKQLLYINLLGATVTREEENDQLCIELSDGRGNLYFVYDERQQMLEWEEAFTKATVEMTEDLRRDIAEDILTLDSQLDLPPQRNSLKDGVLDPGSPTTSMENIKDKLKPPPFDSPKLLKVGSESPKSMSKRMTNRLKSLSETTLSL